MKQTSYYKPLYSIYLLLIILMISIGCCAENATVFSVEERIGDDIWNMISCVTELSDGTMMIGSKKLANNGKRHAWDGEAQDGWCIQIDQSGEVVGEFQITSSAKEGAALSVNNIHESDDGLLLLMRNESPYEDYIVFVDRSGDQRIVSDIHKDYHVSISDSLNTDTGILVAGAMQTDDLTNATWAGFIDQRGEMTWTFSSGETNDVHFPVVKFCATYSNRYYLLTHQQYPSRYAVIELDDSGNQISETLLPYDLGDIDVQGFQVNEKSVVLVGAKLKRYSTSAWAMSLTHDGALLWEKTHENHDRFFAPLATNNQVVCGTEGNESSFVAVLDEYGDLINEGAFISNVRITPRKLKLDKNNDLWIFGDIRRGPSPLGDDIFIGKIDSSVFHP